MAMLQPSVATQLTLHACSHAFPQRLACKRMSELPDAIALAAHQALQAATIRLVAGAAVRVRAALRAVGTPVPLNAATHAADADAGAALGASAASATGRCTQCARHVKQTRGRRMAENHSLTAVRRRWGRRWGCCQGSCERQKHHDDGETHSRRFWLTVRTRIFLGPIRLCSSLLLETRYTRLCSGAWLITSKCASTSDQADQGIIDCERPGMLSLVCVA